MEQYNISNVTTKKEGEWLAAVWHNGWCSTSYDSFVVGSLTLLRLYFCAENCNRTKVQTVTRNSFTQ